MTAGSITRTLVGLLDRAAALVGRASRDPAHLQLGRTGEDEAYFYLRAQGYTVVARNWRTPRRRGELDLIAWEGDVLCFIEVKTRTRKTFVPAEAAVDREKQHELISMARAYLRNQPLGTLYRFDIVSVYLAPGQKPDLALFKDAFGWRTMKATGRRRW